MDYRFAPIDEVVSSAVLICPGATDEHRVIFKQWVWTALLQIGPTSHWVKTCRINPKNRSFKKPQDLASVRDIGLYDATGAEVFYEWKGEGGEVHSDRESVHLLVGESDRPMPVYLSEDAYYFHLSSNSPDVDHMMIRYLALPTDTNGLPLIPEDNIFAITMFIRWMWSLRKNDNQAEQMNARDTWYREKDRIFGDNKMPSWFRAKEFGHKFLSLINGYKTKTF